MRYTLLSYAIATCTNCFKDLGDYDYRPAREVADADETKRYNASDGQTGRHQDSLSLLLPKSYCAARILQT